MITTNNLRHDNLRRMETRCLRSWTAVCDFLEEILPGCHKESDWR
jgi:hypothetical protein